MLHDLPSIRLHDLRHEAASLMGAAGVEPHVIQQVLGHSSAVTTVDTYWQMFRETTRAAANASAKLLRRHANRRRRLGSPVPSHRIRFAAVSWSAWAGQVG
jgi:integrase